MTFMQIQNQTIVV